MSTEQLLQKACSLRDHIDRVEWINSQLEGDIQKCQYLDKYLNLYNYLHLDKEHTIAITVHHDIANKKSQNCLDNNASVVNLINLNNKLVDVTESLQYNVVIAFVDAEETVNPNLSGIKHLLSFYDIHQMVDLELTARGKNVFIDPYDQFDLIDTYETRMPFNNASIASYWKRAAVSPYYRFEQDIPQGITAFKGSACLTLIDEKGLDELREFGSCSSWRLCHSEQDTIDNANVDDMDILVNKLIAYIS